MLPLCYVDVTPVLPLGYDNVDLLLPNCKQSGCCQRYQIINSFNKVHFTTSI